MVLLPAATTTNASLATAAALFREQFIELCLL
jgi:hypothetical protein